jgi:hypothetical protein
MGCGVSVEEPPQPEPAPEREPSMTPAQREMAAINAKIAASPKKDPAKAFKKGDKSTHKVKRVATDDEKQELEEINWRIQEKKKAAAALATSKPGMLRQLTGKIGIAFMDADIMARTTSRAVRTTSRMTTAMARTTSRRMTSRRSPTRGRSNTRNRGLVRQVWL